MIPLVDIPTFVAALSPRLRKLVLTLAGCGYQSALLRHLLKCITAGDGDDKDNTTTTMAFPDLGCITIDILEHFPNEYYSEVEQIRAVQEAFRISTSRVKLCEGWPMGMYRDPNGSGPYYGEDVESD